MQILFTLSVFITILFSSCQLVRPKVYTIGIDPSFYPAPLEGQADNVYGFTADLLQAIASIEKIKIEIIPLGSESTFSGLKLKKYDSIISSLDPVNIQNEWYSVSDLYLKIGPVLIVPYASNLSDLGQFNSKIVGCLTSSDGYYLLQKYPHIVIAPFMNPAFMMEALQFKDIDGAVLGLLAAKDYVHNLYPRILKIVGCPLTSEGLRLVTLKDQQKTLMNHFNHGLMEAEKKGIYQNLRMKWDL